MASKMVTIDGGMLEGGGQILRNAASLSCVLGVPLTVNNIRANRGNPGLRPQHLSGLELIRDLCRGTLQGGEVGSCEVTLSPESIQGGSYLADTRTAGSICLLLQAALPCLLFASGPTRLVLKGGTNADMAPQIDYFTWVFKPIAERFGIHFECDIVKRGYFPKGGGEVVIEAQPLRELKPIDLTDFGKISSISGRAFTAGVLPIKISHAMASEAEKHIKKQYPAVPLNIEAVKEPQHKAFGNGNGIILMAETTTGCRLAGSALGKRDVQPHEVGKKAAKDLLANLSTAACTDDFLQDQLIIFMALAKGRSRVTCGPITLHTQTSIEIVKMLTQAKFEIEQVTEDQNILTCDGIGLQNRNMRS